MSDPFDMLNLMELILTQGSRGGSLQSLIDRWMFCEVFV